MADINCPNCKEFISDTSTFCLHCGFKIIGQSTENAEQITCPECKSEISAISQFCPNCGHKIVEEKALIKCSNCRKKIPEDSKRCPECGFKIEPEVMIYEGDLMQCPNCRRNILQSSQRCGYCGFDFTYKNKNALHIMWCPKCKADVISSAEKCHNCGYRLKPKDDFEENEYDADSFFDNAKDWVGIGVFAIMVFVIFKICTRPSTSDFNYKTPSSSKSNTEATFGGQSLGYKMATIDTKEYYSETDPLVKRYNNMFDQLDVKFIESEDRIADMTVVAKNELEKIGLNEPMINIMEGICRLVDVNTKTRKYADNVSCYIIFRSQGFNHSAALKEMQDLLTVMSMETIIMTLSGK